ncbi:hypothetical protein G3T36_18285 [Diaminobutyricibacter tongyongensis]|uniref:Uncharacterized protein n=1 Tax=Leifsonia tongyongensis TaxID=1268043 RepID=A0A6L9Y3I2_9MICO|nr:hypothetical protein [Diaminobutyricibacter tongyongensis]NEN07808.1 hypothetical protein [Diaminobutyricibacter tongyongensis]
MRREIAIAALVAVLGVCLAGCGANFHLGSGIAYPQASLPPCAVVSSPAPVPVEKLREIPTCDIGGQQILFPDGYIMTAPSYGAMSGSSTCTPRPSPNPKGKVDCGGKYESANLGIWGVDAIYISPDGKHRTYWGTPTAVKKEKEAR